MTVKELVDHWKIDVSKAPSLRLVNNTIDVTDFPDELAETHGDLTIDYFIVISSSNITVRLKD